MRSVQKWSKKRVQKKWYLCGFSGFHPSMVSRASLGEAPGLKSTSKWRPGHGFSVISGPCFHFLWRHFGIFPVFHERQIDSTRCSVYGCFCLGLGGKPKVDASQMPPRCLSDASQMPPRCLPDASSLNDFFSMILCSMIPPQGSLLYHRSSSDASFMITRHGFLLHDSLNWCTKKLCLWSVCMRSCCKLQYKINVENPVWGLALGS